MLMQKFFIEDGELLPVEEFQANTGIEIYEVIRVMEGVPLFLEDHLKRFFHSAWLLHLQIPLTEQEIRERLEKLITSNIVREGNIRFSYCFRPYGRFQAYFIPHFYPGPSMVGSGVACELLNARRSDPNVKAVQAGLRILTDQMISETGSYEVLLVDDRGRITEGSRSNVFFVRGEKLITAPDEDILPGITRKKVLELARELFIPVVFEALPEEDLLKVDAVFLTGTSPKVLPVKKIGEIPLKVVNPVVLRIIEGYDWKIRDYIEKQKTPN